MTQQSMDIVSGLAVDRQAMQAVISKTQAAALLAELRITVI
ncbi:hypothetical protein [Achromobacter xylosoxidans]|nr:hypothetical protein [Achromobacter xylosoxidans]MCZ8390350.1 hypothetical protein [Achromobacter xylosoxidans]